MRMFVALVPPPEALEDLAAVMAPRQEAGSSFRWTTEDQWHVTLAFMPHVQERNLDDLTARLERAAARRTPFSACLAGGGAFPNPVRAKVLFTGVQVTPRPEELRRLATGARAAANKAGAEAEGGRFHAHLTLARLKRPAEATRWLRVLEAYRGPVWPAEEIVLIESHLGEGPRNRPRYEVVDSFRLGRSQDRHHDVSRTGTDDIVP
jgi:2'-5' RNA ligase